MSWWCYRMTRTELVEIPPQIYCNGVFRKKKWNLFFYGNIHGEEIIRKSNPNWAEDFIRDFATFQIPFHFLCTHKLLAIKGHFMNERCELSNGIVSYRRHCVLFRTVKPLKRKMTRFFRISMRRTLILPTARTVSMDSEQSAEKTEALRF